MDDHIKAAAAFAIKQAEGPLNFEQIVNALKRYWRTNPYFRSSLIGLGIGGGLGGLFGDWDDMLRLGLVGSLAGLGWPAARELYRKWFKTEPQKT